jgi:hypothetical protein
MEIKYYRNLGVLGLFDELFWDQIWELLSGRFRCWLQNRSSYVFVFCFVTIDLRWKSPGSSTYKADRHGIAEILLKIRVITKLPNSEQSYKGKVKTHKYINRQNQSTTGKL